MRLYRCTIPKYKDILILSSDGIKGVIVGVTKSKGGYKIGYYTKFRKSAFTLDEDISSIILKSKDKILTDGESVYLDFNDNYILITNNNLRLIHKNQIGRKLRIITKLALKFKKYSSTKV